MDEDEMTHNEPNFISRIEKKHGAIISGEMSVYSCALFLPK